ncbi:MAG: metalloprotease TldD, partial [Proteobacteria bacterium]|nr:metalloprotease TldD [Pseudomonadota bacterium]
MIEPPKADEFFFTHAGLEKARIQSVIDDALGGLDDGELYFQYGLSEVFSFDNGHLKTAAFDTTQGFGLRGVVGEVTGYAHSNELTEEAIKRAAGTITAIKSG